MTAVSGAISFVLGLPLGLLLVNTAPAGLWPDLIVRARGSRETTRIAAQRVVNAAGSVAPDQCDG